jgi:L-threonylcarbamoyladenylate synthase
VLVRVDPFDPEPAAIAAAAELLRGGGLVAFPTETVYGLGANALDEAAVRRIFAAKGRPAYNPLIAHLPDAAAARALVADWPEAAARLAAAFWPGPLTLVLRKTTAVPALLTAGLDTVAVRVPAHPVARALLRAAAVPVAAPSANPFTRLSPTTAAHVAAGLGDRVDMILDGGATPLGIESTVVALTGDGPRLLRPGALGAAEVEAVLGRPLAGAGPAAAAAEARPAPGMLDRHYAPRAELRLFGDSPRTPAPDAATPRLDRAGAVALLRAAAAAGRATGALLRTPLDAPVHHPIPLPDEPAGYGRLLYAALHSLDDAGCDLVLVELPPPDPAWSAVRDRLARAAHPASGG